MKVTTRTRKRSLAAGYSTYRRGESIYEMMCYDLLKCVNGDIYERMYERGYIMYMRRYVMTCFKSCSMCHALLYLCFSFGIRKKPMMA